MPGMNKPTLRAPVGDWSDETVLRLKELWGEGHTTAEIGRRLGVTKNAVVGKVRRLKLIARPNPVIRKITEAASAAPRSRVPAKPGNADESVRTKSAGASPARTSPPIQGRRVMACCWPIGTPGRPDFRFCGDSAQPGRPYCAAHADLAYARHRPEHRT